MSRGRAPSALRRPISRMRSVTETNMMFITPMPPTSSEMIAMPPSITVSVSSTELAAVRIDCWVAIEKSALAAVVIWCVLSRSAFASWYAAESVPADVAFTEMELTEFAARAADEPLRVGAERHDRRGRCSRSAPDELSAWSTPMTSSLTPL